ncbi:hypothetical protein D8S78_11205 [Natrialba swarupiae]|nr:hypothetical protein [Natrialba swarupiae]
MLSVGLPRRRRLVVAAELLADEPSPKGFSRYRRPVSSRASTIDASSRRSSACKRSWVVSWSRFRSSPRP